MCGVSSDWKLELSTILFIKSGKYFDFLLAFGASIFWEIPNVPFPNAITRLVLRQPFFKYLYTFKNG
jgi:hypothetical protein